MGKTGREGRRDEEKRKRDVKAKDKHGDANVLGVTSGVGNADNTHAPSPRLGKTHLLARYPFSATRCPHHFLRIDSSFCYIKNRAHLLRITGILQKQSTIAYSSSMRLLLIVSCQYDLGP